VVVLVVVAVLLLSPIPQWTLEASLVAVQG
jgi:competence protein ComGC